MISFQPTPIIVRAVEAPTRETSVYDVLIGSVGLIGVIVLAMVLVGAVFGLLFIGLNRWRASRKTANAPEAVQLHLGAGSPPA